MRRTTIAIAVLIMAELAVTSPPARACSIGSIPNPREQVASAHAAIIGVLISTTGLKSRTFSTTDQVTMKFTVEWDIKGNVGRKVDVRTSAGSSSCGIGDIMSPGERVGLILQGGPGAWFAGLGDLTSPERLLRAARPLKAPGGIPAFLAQAHDAGLTAFDLRGKTIAYGGEEHVLTVCPGGRRVITTGLWVRNVNTFTPTSPRFDLARFTSGHAPEVSCRNEAGTDILIFAHDQARKFGKGVVLRIQGTRIAKLHELSATAGVFDAHGKFLYFGGGEYGHELSRLDLGSGRRQILARINAEVRSLSLSPNGRFLANASRDDPFMRTPGPSPITLLDVITRRVSHASVRRGSPGSMLWRDSETVVFVPEYQGWTDVVRVYDTRLRETGRILPWLAQESWLDGNRLVGAYNSKIVAAELPSGQITDVVTLDQEATRIVPVPSGVGEIDWPAVPSAIDLEPKYLGQIGLIDRVRSRALGTSGWVLGIALVVVFTVFMLIRSAKKRPPDRPSSVQPAP